MKKLAIRNKKAVSLMISYVLLIAIAIGLSIGVYAWLKLISNISPAINCKEGTSLILESQNCYPGNVEFNLKNNGRFNIDGVVIAVGENPKNTPTTYLTPHPTGGVINGDYIFLSSLNPGDSAKAIFTNQEIPPKIQNIRIVQIQPFIIDKNQKIICQNSVIKQEIEPCQAV